MPDWKALVRGRLAPLRVDPSRESDIVDELAQHVAQHHADLIASGLANRAAIEMALAPLDDREGVAAEIARADRARPVAPEPPRSAAFRPADLARELRHALRLL